MKISFAQLLLSAFLFFPFVAQAQFGLMLAKFYDESRDRTVGVDIFYPANEPGVNVSVRDGKYPVVVFGHGMAMPVQSYRHFVTRLNDEGYVVALPKTEMSMTPSHDHFSKDLAMIPQVLMAESKNPESPLYEGLNGKFALVGHSMGAGASFWAATYSNRFETIVALAPAEFAPRPSTAAAEIDLPVLFITGTMDGVTSRTGHILPIYTALDVPCKQLVSIIGGSHCGFSNPNWLCDMGENILAPATFIDYKEQHQITYDYMIPWLNYYLDNDCKTMVNLNSFGMEDERVEYLNECIAYVEPCAVIEDEFLRLQPLGTDYQWKLNGTVLAGENAESVSTHYGSGVYQCITTLNNGCEVRSEPFWHHSDIAGVAGNLQFRLYQKPAERTVLLEIFGAEFPVKVNVFDASGNQLLHQEVTGHLHEVDLPEEHAGLLFYSLQSNGKTIGRGKLLRN